jgi:acyl carrier protein
MPDTLAVLQTLISERYGVPSEELYPDQTMDKFNLDSVELVDLMCCIEDHFRIKLPGFDAEIKTLNQLALWVDSIRVASGGAPSGQ